MGILGKLMAAQREWAADREPAMLIVLGERKRRRLERQGWRVVSVQQAHIAGTSSGVPQYVMSRAARP